MNSTIEITALDDDSLSCLNSILGEGDELTCHDLKGLHKLIDTISNLMLISYEEAGTDPQATNAIIKAHNHLSLATLELQSAHYYQMQGGQ